MKDSYVIDADGHVGETTVGKWLPIEFLPKEYHDQAPQYAGIFRDVARFRIEGRIHPKGRGKGTSVHGPIAGGTRLAPRPQGLNDPQARMPDMDLEGLDVSVLFGAMIGLGVSGLKEARLAQALARAYNDWVANYCSAYPQRLKAVASVPLQDVEAASKEMRRAVTRLGFVGVAVPSHVWGKHLGHPSFDPFYAEAQELDIPVCVHATSPTPGIKTVGGAELFDVFFFTHMFHHCSNQMVASLAVIGSGVLDRFPRLRFAFLEGWCGWVPFWLERMQEHYRKLGAQIDIKRSPLAYLESGRLYFACESGEESLPYVVDRIGAEHIVYASDYWHWDSSFPR